MNMKENQSPTGVRKPGNSPAFSPIELDPVITISLSMSKQEVEFVKIDRLASRSGTRSSVFAQRTTA
jgi:hypothetical protein